MLYMIHLTTKKVNKNNVKCKITLFTIFIYNLLENLINVPLYLKKFPKEMLKIQFGKKYNSIRIYYTSYSGTFTNRANSI